MQMISIMQEFHWTFDEYMDTPQHVLVLIKEKMARDRKAQELEAKKRSRGN